MTSGTIQIKRRATGGAAGAPATLKTAELAWNFVDNIVYGGFGDNGSGTATSITPIGGIGAFLDLTSAQTIGGQKTFSLAPRASVAASTNTDLVRKQEFDAGISGHVNSLTTAASQDVTLGGTTGAITAVLATVNANVGAFTKVTVNGKGLVTAATTLAASDIPTLTAAKISDFNTAVRTNRLNELTVPNAEVSFNGQVITDVAEPTNATDAATKSYVDSIAQGLDAKDSVSAATTANITLSGTQTIDGVVLVANDRVLVKNQSTASQNGIYVVSAGSWSRSTDANAWAELDGAFVFVEDGSVNASSGWVSTSAKGGTLGSTAVSFTQFSGAGAVVAGNGLSKSGNTLTVGGTANRITVGATTVDIAATYVGQNTITTLGTITTGVWTGTAIALANGGTGATSASAARTNLGLGTIATQAASAVAITGGTITGVTITDGIDGGTF